MKLPVAERWLSASINAPAAWAAYATVRDLDWSLRVATWSPFSLEVVESYAFRACLDGAGSDQFATRARGELALRLLQIAADFDDTRLQVRQLSAADLQASPAVERRTLDDLKSTILSRLRQELTYQFDTSPANWADRAELALTGLQDDHRQRVRQYLGLDQALTDKQCASGLKYAFTTLMPSIKRTGSSMTLAGHERKLREAREARSSTEPKARARNLAARAVEACLANIRLEPGDDTFAATSDVEVLCAVQQTLEELLRLHGCWALIDLTITRDRVEQPDYVSPEVWELIREQERRVVEIDRKTKS